MVIDDGNPSASSRVAAGIINPITGRRMVKTWMIDTFLPVAYERYNEWGNELGVTAINQRDIVDFFPSPQMRLAFIERMSEDPAYLSMPDDLYAYSGDFNYDFGFGMISPCYVVNTKEILSTWREKLLAQGKLYSGTFRMEDLDISNERIRYSDITASRIIFCDGVGSFHNPWFRNLPFANNKGEALIIHAPNLPSENIFKKGISLVPLGDELFWVGSSYEWEFTENGPTELFSKRMEQSLKGWLKSPFKMVDHLAGLRPATLERRPFVGFHPSFPHIGILNGMGTKGCSLAPYFAYQLVQLMLDGSPVDSVADVGRFRKVLDRV